MRHNKIKNLSTLGIYLILGVGIYIAYFMVENYFTDPSTYPSRNQTLFLLLGIGTLVGGIKLLSRKNMLDALLADKIIVRLIISWSVIMTVWRAIRRPNDWAEAQWLIGYRYGYVKRGLIGTIMRGLGFYNNPELAESMIEIFSIILFIAFIFLLFYVSDRIISASGWNTNTIFMMTLFLTSPFIVMSAHLMGYFDNLLQMIAMVSILLLAREKYFSAAVIQTIAIFIHESYLLIGFPVVIFSIYLLLSSKEKKSNRELIGKQLIVILIPIIVFVGLLLYQDNIDQTSLFEVLQQELISYGFVQDGREELVADSFTTSFRFYFITESPKFLNRLLAPRFLTTVVPLLLVVVVFIQKQFGVRFPSFEFFIMLGAILSPLLLHLVARDIGRIWMYSIFNSFLVIHLYSEFKVRQSPIPEDSFWLAFIIVLLLNIFASTQLMDHLIEGISTRRRILLYIPLIYLVYSARRVSSKESLQSDS